MTFEEFSEIVIRNSPPGLKLIPSETEDGGFVYSNLNISPGLISFIGPEEIPETEEELIEHIKESLDFLDTVIKQKQLLDLFNDKS